MFDKDLFFVKTPPRGLPWLKQGSDNRPAQKKGLFMRFVLNSYNIAQLGSVVVKRKLGKSIKVVQKGGCAVVFAKKVYKLLNNTNSVKNVVPKSAEPTGYWQGYLLNFIQTEGRIVLPIKQIRLSTHPEVEIKDWVIGGMETMHIKPRVTAKRFIKKKNKGYTHDKALALYASDAWRTLRYDVLREQGGCCQLCGRGRKDGVILHVDHIIPLSVDWSKRLDKDNLQVLCQDCNLGKSNTDDIDWR